MTLASRRFILQGALFGAACACGAAAVGAASAQTPAGQAPPAAPGQKYTCPPCGCAADGKQFDAPGNCPECGMPLVLVPADKTGAPPPPKLAAARAPKAGLSAAKSAPA